MIIAARLTETRAKKNYYFLCMELSTFSSRKLGVLGWRVAGGSWPHRVTGVDNEMKEEIKSAGVGCDFIIAFFGLM